jgi:hypothetical protein
MVADRNLFLGVLALQIGLIDQGQLVLGHNAGPVRAPCDPTASAPRQFVQRELRPVLQELSVVLKLTHTLRDHLRVLPMRESATVTLHSIRRSDAAHR